MNDEVTQFDRHLLEDEGDVISGLKVDDHRFVAVMAFGKLMKLTENPLLAAKADVRKDSPRADEYFTLHSEIQREFDKGKRENAEAYARYIIDLKNGSEGDTPSIDLFVPTKLRVAAGQGSQKAELLWPHGLTAVPYDGETQTAARFIAASSDKETMKMPVIVTVMHGRPVKWARQAFHDRNAFQRRASVGVALAMDGRDPMVATVRYLEESIPNLKGNIVWKSRQMPKAGDFIAAASFVRTAIACFVNGMSGVQAASSNLPPGVDPSLLEERSRIWFSKVIEKVGPYMKDRENYVASSPAIWAALGAMGKEIMDASTNTPPHTLNAIADGLVGRLNGVDWRKSENWIGIAVKKTASGYSFAGGAKDSGSIALRALSDQNDANFNRIRSLAAKAA